MKIGRQRRAYHAAGNAVAAIAHNLAVDSVSLPAVGATGHAGATYERAIYHAADNAEAQVAALKIDIIVLLAGPAAQMAMRPGKQNHPECDDDLQLARAWSTWAAFIANVMSIANIAEFKADGMIELSEEEQTYADCLIDECRQRADQIVADHWDWITIIARALLDGAVLSADNLKALILVKPNSQPPH